MTSSLGRLGANRKIRFFYSPSWMVLVGLVARVLYILIAHTYCFSAAHWSTWEMANLAIPLPAAAALALHLAATPALPPGLLHSIPG